MAKVRGPKRETIIIKGEYVWPHLLVPDRKSFDEGKTFKEQYKTNFRVSDDELKRLKAKFTAAAIKEMEREGKDVDEDWRPKMPFQKNKETKEITVVAASKNKPGVFDSKNNPLPADVSIGGGSLGAIDVTINPYTGFGGGVNLYLNLVQVSKLEENTQGKPRFEATEGYTYEGGGSKDDDEDDASESFGRRAPSNKDLDDEIPF